MKTLHPFTWRELGDEFSLPKALHTGLLPGIYFSDDPRADLEAYVGQYLKDEIAAIVASFEPAARRVGRIEILPWQLVLERLWAGDLSR
jgi:hypothetical protein